MLVSLLYRKHPSALKFVLVDPKKVELSVYNKISRHYLAQLPGAEEAIITDTDKVVATLNSLCKEMDQRNTTKNLNPGKLSLTLVRTYILNVVITTYLISYS